MTRDELVELMARAIRVAYCGQGAAEGWDGLAPEHKRVWLSEATAALTELEKHAVVTARPR